MPGSTGTGYPFTFRCAKCKRLRDWQRPEHEDKGCNVEATGRTRPLAAAQQGYGHRRALQYRVEYRCLDCGHIGWSRHVHMKNLLAKVKGKVDDYR